MTSSFHFPKHPNGRRGSVLIVTLILSAVIGISLVSYIKISTNSLKLAQRSFLANSAMNYAEIGLEEATYCYNLLATTPVPEDAWRGNGWTIAAGSRSATRTLTYAPGQNAAVTVKAWVDYYNPPPTLQSPKLVVQTTLDSKDGSAPVIKMIEVTLRRRSLYAIGLLARNILSLKPTVSTVDSWNANPTNSPTATPIPYSVAVRRSNGTVGSPNKAPNAVDLGNSKIYGYVATGGGSITYSPAAVVSGSFTGTGIDWTRVTYDFAANFVLPVPPTPATTNWITTSITASTTLPRSTDTPNPSDGRYYYTFAAGTNIKLTGSNSITIAGPVTMLLNSHAGVVAMNTVDSASITVNATNSSLYMYTNGHVDAYGTGGFLNKAGTAPRCMVYGTSTTPLGQRIVLEGNNTIPPIVAIYAPNADFKVDSNADMKGAVVAYNIYLNADTGFHFDESLLNVGGNPFGITKWKELRTPAERAAYATKLAF